MVPVLPVLEEVGIGSSAVTITQMITCGLFLAKVSIVVDVFPGGLRRKLLVSARAKLLYLLSVSHLQILAPLSSQPCILVSLNLHCPYLIPITIIRNPQKKKNTSFTLPFSYLQPKLSLTNFFQCPKTDLTETLKFLLTKWTALLFYFLPL